MEKRTGKKEVKEMQKQKRSSFAFMLVSASIAFVIATSIAIAAGWGLVDTILLSLSSIFGGAVIGAAIHLERENSIYIHEMQEARRKNLQLVKDAVARSHYLRNRQIEEGEDSISIVIFSDSTIYQGFSAKATPNSVIFNTVMLDRSTGRRIAGELTVTTADDDGLYDAALRHFDNPSFISTLTPFSREVNVKA